MKYRKFALTSNTIHLYPLVCHHFGAKQSSSTFVETVIDHIDNDPLGRWIYMGDAGECVTRLSKGNIYEQLLSPGDQMRVAEELYGPIASKGLFGIRGNHGNRIDKEVGLGWDEMLCSKVGIPYLGVSALVNISMPRGNISLFTHHGSSNEITPAGKMSGAHKGDGLVDADVILTAHTHACGEAWPRRIYATLDNHVKRIKWKESRSFVCGSAYDSRSGYAEEKMYPPLIPEHLMISISIDKKGEILIGHNKILQMASSGEVVMV